MYYSYTIAAKPRTIPLSQGAVIDEHDNKEKWEESAR